MRDSVDITAWTGPREGQLLDRAGSGPRRGPGLHGWLAIALLFLAGILPGTLRAQATNQSTGSPAQGVANLCQGTRPGTLISHLRCPGGYPLTTPWILWPGVGLLVLSTGLALKRRRRARVEPDLPWLIFQPPHAARGSAGQAAGSEAAGSEAAGLMTSGLPPRIDVAPSPDQLPPRGASPGAVHSPGTFPLPRAAPPAPATPIGPAMGDPTAALPADEATVQLLPGRLTILVGAGRDREFRFIRTPGQVTEVTIGREAGSGPHHVQLAALTVSRLHARMRFEDGGWRIENLSRTNPLVINGQPTSAELPVRLLEEGDRIEIGEFVLLFHER